MKNYILKDYEQALILACKGHCRRDGENTYDSIKRIVSKIIGCGKEHITDKIISFWLYETFERLNEIEETYFKRRNSTREFMLNNYQFFDSTVETMSFDGRVIKFLILEIMSVQVYESDKFRIELDKNNKYSQ